MRIPSLTAAPLLASTLALSACFTPDEACEGDSCGETDGTTGTTTSVATSETSTPLPSTSSTTSTTASDDTTTGGPHPADSSSTGEDAGTSSSTGEPEPAECGNGIVEEDEACDDGDDNGEAPDACRADCTEASCGDGIVDTDEECDSEANDCLRDCTYDTNEFGPFPTATAAVGQPDLTSSEQNALGYAFRFPSGVFSYDGHLYVPNGQGSGVFVFDGIPTESGATPDGVLGRDGVQGPANPFGPASLGGFVHSLSVDDGRMAIADPEGPRILLFNDIPTDDAQADLAIGQPNLTTQESGVSQDRFVAATDVFVANDRMIVADRGGNRALVWNTVPTLSGALPVVVLGQDDFDEGEANRGGDPDADTLSGPNAVWTDGSRFAVADSQNHRVLLWDAFPTENGQPADHVIGQEDMTTVAPGGGSDGFNLPQDLTFVGNRLYVADQFNHRIMLFNGWPTSDGQEASGVVGQSNFDNLTSNDDDQNGVNDGAATGRTLARPSALHVDGNQLFVADSFNHRILVFDGI